MYLWLKVLKREWWEKDHIKARIWNVFLYREILCFIKHLQRNLY